MTDLFWLEWPLVERGYKAEGEKRTWLVRQDRAGYWRLGTVLDVAPVIPALTGVGVYETRGDAERIAQQLENLWALTSVHWRPRFHHG